MKLSVNKFTKELSCAALESAYWDFLRADQYLPHSLGKGMIMTGIVTSLMI